MICVPTHTAWVGLWLVYGPWLWHFLVILTCVFDNSVKLHYEEDNVYIEDLTGVFMFYWISNQVREQR